MWHSWPGLKPRVHRGQTGQRSDAGRKGIGSRVLREVYPGSQLMLRKLRLLRVIFVNTHKSEQFQQSRGMMAWAELSGSIAARRAQHADQVLHRTLRNPQQLVKGDHLDALEMPVQAT